MGIMPDYRQHLPDVLARNEGQWVWHEGIRPGVYKHISATGEECITVRAVLPPNGRLSSRTLRLFADLIDAYAEGGRRTSRNGFEFIGVRPDGVDSLISELARAGFPVGGTGTSLHQIKSCPGYLHCQNALIDSPSMAKAIGDHFYDDVVNQRFPASIKVSVSGCANQCGGAIEADVGVSGVFADPPKVDDNQVAKAKCDVNLLCAWCPTGAIRPKALDDGLSVEINVGRCVRCGSCATVCPAGITIGRDRGVAIAVGGMASNTTRGPRLAKIVVPFMPTNGVAEYAEAVKVVARIVEAWRSQAREGERLGDFTERIGWPAFFRLVGLPFDARVIDNFFPISVRRNLQMRVDSNR